MRVFWSEVIAAVDEAGLGIQGNLVVQEMWRKEKLGIMKDWKGNCTTTTRIEILLIDRKEVVGGSAHLPERWWIGCGEGAMHLCKVEGETIPEGEVKKLCVSALALECKDADKCEMRRDWYQKWNRREEKSRE